MKKKEFEIESINYALYEARNKKKLTLKAAAKGLRITRFHLNLIEKGYVHVSKRLKPRFINFYHLNKDFFNKNTTYVTPVNINYEDPHLEEKIRANIKKKRTKLVSGIIPAVLLGVLSAGVYFYERDNVNPKASWSNEFTTFHSQFIDKHEGEEESSEYPGDIDYFISDNFEISGRESSYTMSLPIADTHASGLSVVFNCYDVLEITNFAYNQKKIAIFDGQISMKFSVYAVCSYATRDNYKLPKITLTDSEGVSKDYYPDSQEYKAFYDKYLSKGSIYDQFVEATNSSLASKGISGNFDQIMNDTQTISAHKVFGFRLGFRMILFSAMLLIFSLSVFTYALIKGRKIKPKKVKARPYVVHKTEYTADAALVYRSVPNDLAMPMLIPEFVLRILALGALLLSSIGVVWLTQISLAGIESTKETFELNAYVSNLLVTGMTLAFFLKLDIYHKRSNRELLDNIIMLFVFGLIFYVAECIVYTSLTSQGTIYSELIKLLTGLIPGNIIWNLMLYSLIFFFLFTTPKRIEDTPHKVFMWRLGSIIPVLLLLSAFVVKGSLQGTLSPYVSFLFHTNGALLTAFAIFYLYALFFFQQYVSLKYGKEFEKVFLDSRRYALCKNIIACIVILVLSLIDLLFYFKLPFNSLNLGTNWIIAGLIPFILFYHPHIGKRAPKWDLAYNIMYVVFLVGGYLIAFNMIANSLDLSQIAEIIG